MQYLPPAVAQKTPHGPIALQRPPRTGRWDYS